VALDAARLDVNHSYRLAPKSGEARHVPIVVELSPILRWWKERCPSTKEGLVFPVLRERGGLRMGDEGEMLGIVELLAAAGCHAPEKPWHALRHTFAAHAVMSGTSLYSLQKLMGHSTPMMTQRYAHLAPDYLAAELARLSFAAPAPAGVADLTEERRRRVADGMDR